MKVELNNKSRKLVAVMSPGKDGVFFQNNTGKGTTYINHNGQAGYCEASLEYLVNENVGRTPIYEGDIITLTF